MVVGDVADERYSCVSGVLFVNGEVRDKCIVCVGMGVVEVCIISHARDMHTHGEMNVYVECGLNM